MFDSLMRITVTTELGKRAFAGAVIGGKPRVVEVKGMELDSPFLPAMLYVNNLDKPGFIGSLGRTLGDGQINIAAFHNGRLAEGQRAFCLVSVDQRIGDALLKRIGSLPNVVSVTDLTF